MKIVVLLKETPDTEAKLTLASDKSSVEMNGVKFVVNPYDEFAIEEAIKLKEQHGGEITLLSFAPAAVKERLLKGLAMGADKGIIVDSTQRNWSSLAISKVLATVLEKEAPDLVLCGKQAIDDDNMHVGVMTAELLKWPHVNVAGSLSITDKTAAVEREVEGGMVECYDIQLPAIIGANKSLNTPRYASLPGIMKAKKKPVAVWTLSDLSLDESALDAFDLTEVSSFEYPTEKAKGQLFQDEPAEVMVDKVLALLKDEAKVL